MATLALQTREEQLIEKLNIFKIQGKDKQGNLSIDVLKNYLEKRIYQKLERKQFCVVYLHTGVERSENFPGISGLRSIYVVIPSNVKKNLKAVYFVHPGLQSKLFFATFGRFLFNARLYGKLRYVNRLDLLWEHLRRNEIEIPEFVQDHNEDLEYRPMMDYDMESDHPRIYDALCRFPGFHVLNEMHLLRA